MNGQRGARRPEELQGMPRKGAKYFDGNRPEPTRMPKRTFTVTKMQDVHHEIARRLLLGQKDVYIAKQLGITVATVGYTKNSPVVREKLALMRNQRDQKTIDVASHIQRIAPKSIQLLEEVITTTFCFVY